MHYVLPEPAYATEKQVEPYPTAQGSVGDSVSPVFMITAGHWIFSGFSELLHVRTIVLKNKKHNLTPLSSQLPIPEICSCAAATSKATDQNLGTKCPAKCPVQPDTLSGHFLTIIVSIVSLGPMHCKACPPTADTWLA